MISKIFGGNSEFKLKTQIEKMLRKNSDEYCRSLILAAMSCYEKSEGENFLHLLNQLSHLSRNNPLIAQAKMMGIDNPALRKKRMEYKLISKIVSKLEKLAQIKEWGP